MKEKALMISLLFNLVLIGILGYILYKKGGMVFLKRKMGIGKDIDSGFGPYYDQRKSLFEVLPRDTSDIIFLGHSLMDGCEWSELLDNPKIKNRGINGEITDGILNRLDVVMNPPPAKLFLMTGANDIGSNIPVDKILYNCRRIVDSLKLNCPTTKVYLISVLPIGYDYDKNAAEVIDSFNEGLSKMAAENNYVYIDLFSMVQDKNGYFDPEFSNDGSHLMGKGYLKIREKMKGYLNE